MGAGIGIYFLVRDDNSGNTGSNDVADSVFMLSFYANNPLSGDFIGQINSNATYSTVSVPVAAASTIRKISVLIQTAPSEGQISSFVLYKNGVATATTITISDTNLASNATLSESIAENDTIALEFVQTGGAASPGTVRITVYFEAA